MLEKPLSPGPVTKAFEGTAEASQEMPAQTNTSTRHIIDILIHGLSKLQRTFNWNLPIEDEILFSPLKSQMRP